MAQPAEKMHRFRTVLRVNNSDRSLAKVESWISKKLVCALLTSATTRIVWCVNEMFQIMLP